MSDAVLESAESAEASVAALVGERYSGAASAAPSVSEPAEEVTKFEFDADFQTQVAIHTVRDLEFVRKVGHLLKPDYFENVGEAAMVNIALRFYGMYGTVPSAVAAKQLFKDDITAKVIRSDIKPVCLEAFRTVFQPAVDLSNGDFYVEAVTQFAKHQAMGAALMRSVMHRERGDYEAIEKDMKAALSVAANAAGVEYDYWAKIVERTAVRIDKASGKIPPQGITTGHLQMDQLLYHRGFGRRELTAILGGAKAGKTTALINFGKSAALAGHNVLYISCEVAVDIIADRADAAIADTLVKELGTKINEVKAKIEAMAARAGKFIMHEYPTGTLTPSMLRALIERYKSPGLNPDGTVRPPIIFDEVIVDYADIMAPDVYTREPIENSKQIWIALRAIAQEENVAMLTATQSNREGMKATIIKATDVADDINKVRTVDLMISINYTDEERAAGECRLFFAASRNQESGFTLFVKQDLARMIFIRSILRVE
jgi:replicative DNA helicase